MTEIDDEMVERAAQAAYEADGRGPYDWLTCSDTGKRAWRAFIRAGLVAALNPKPEPEIEVTEGMRKDGWARMWSARGFLTVPEMSITDEYAVQEMFRAMLKKQAQEGAASAAKPAPQGVSAAAPVKETGGGVVRAHGRHNDFGRRFHRRWND